MINQESETVFQRIVGSEGRQGTSLLSEPSELPILLRKALVAYYGADLLLSPPQEDALIAGVAESKGKDYLIAAPTNSGKTLIAVFRIFTAAITGGLRSAYVVPLKALAEEKLVEFSEIAEIIESLGGPKIKISITTGDYQLTDDFLGSPPPADGEIIICTPERLEVMLRNPECLEWARGVGTYVLDEFHLLGDRTRGGTMEILISRFLAFCPWSCILSLSATVGGLDAIEQWLTHSGRKLKVISSDYRFPQLDQSIVVSQDKETFIFDYVESLIKDPSRSLLVFVGTKDSTRALADKLRKQCPSDVQVGYFNAGVSVAERKKKTEMFFRGKCRIMVTTTSLKMGVNFPVTDVIVRDLVLGGRDGASRLSYGDLLQMMGRAGRADIRGRATVLCGDAEEAERYSDVFEKNEIEPLQPQLVRKQSGWSRKKLNGVQTIDPLNGLLLAELARQKETDINEIELFLNHTYSAVAGNVAIGDLQKNINFLHRSKLIYPAENSEGRWVVTKLGRTVVYSGLSPESGSMLAGLLRALINLAEKEKEASGRSKDFLNSLTNLDFLFLAVSSFENRNSWLRVPKPEDVAELEEYLEGLPIEEKPFLNRWRSENSKKYPTRRLLSTLKIPYESNIEGAAEVAFYRVMRTSVLLHRHAFGERLGSLANEYTKGRSKVYEGNLESGLKFTTTWVLSCLSQICDPRKCYKIEKLKLRIFGLLNELSFGSNLGKLLQIKGVGRKTVETLIANGVTDLNEVEKLSRKNLEEMGIKVKQVSRILVNSRRSRR